MALDEIPSRRLRAIQVDSTVVVAREPSRRKPPARPSRPSVDGKFLRVAEQRVHVKGVTYGSFRSNEEGEPFPPFHQLRDDFSRMRDAGINTVRLYSPPTDRIADAAAQIGLYLIPDICWGPRRCELDDPDRLKFIYGWVREHARRLSDHPAILIHSIGNEIPPLIVRWYGRNRIESFLRTIAEIIREESPDSLITYANHPPTEHLNLAFLDVVAFNVYLEREKEFRDYLARLQVLAGNRPLILTELGLDSTKNGEEEQAASLKWQLRAVIEKGLSGATVYGWTDDWAIFDTHVEGWAFGLTNADRTPKLALEAVKQIYTSRPHSLRATAWPKVSVVVATYNGGRTLDRCLGSLETLDYPNYEVIVVNDGSIDNTCEIVWRHDVECISVSNGGLSRARNIGIAAASGEIVAFIDSDAYADPEWLTHLVMTLEEHDAAAVGGPNLSPPQDPFVAQSIDLAPGNPTHVLLDNDRAEHVPGCNMAFRKDALQQIGGFDERHRAAGDDVDVCWKLLVREMKIVFAASAVVWHHRRSTVRAYLKQQKGYGYAEAHLAEKYPGRFNLFGHSVWRGSVYDAANDSAMHLPWVLRPRIYQGVFGGAQFQSLYQPFASWWFQVFTVLEWQLAALCFLLAGWLARPGSLIGPAQTLLGAAMLAVTASSALLSAHRGVKTKNWNGARRILGLMLVAFLHIAQPFARGAGRLRGWLNTRSQNAHCRPSQRVWGNLEQRDKWLIRLTRHLAECGWVCRPSSEWSHTDLDILGPGPYTLHLSSVYEDDVERGFHFIRYRISTRAKIYAPILILGLSAALVSCMRRPVELPFVFPVSILLGRFLQARSHMSKAVLQLASECAEALHMPNAEGY